MGRSHIYCKLNVNLTGAAYLVGQCGVVVVRVDAFAFFSQGDLRTCIDVIAAFLYQCPQDTPSDVSAVLVYEKWRGGPEERFTVDDGSADADESQETLS